MTGDDCQSECWIEEWATEAHCSLPPSHSGKHWDKDEGWEW